MKYVTFKRDSVLSRSILPSAPYITGLLSFLMVGLSGLRALSRNYVSTINGVFALSSSFSLPPALLFSQEGLSQGSEKIFGVLSHTNTDLG